MSSQTVVMEHSIEVVEIHKKTPRGGTLISYFAACTCKDFKSKNTQSRQKAERAGGDHLSGVGSRPL